MSEAKYCIVCGGKYKSSGKCPEGFYPGSYEAHLAAQGGCEYDEYGDCITHTLHATKGA